MEKTGLRELDHVYRGLVDWMVKHPEELLASRKELQHKLLKKRLIYGDATMQTTLMPIFLKRKSLEKIRQTALVLDRVVDKVVNRYFEDEHVRDHFPRHYAVPRDWIHAETGYQKPTVLNRLDVLFDGKTLKYIEFNTDNPGGKGWVDMLEQLFLHHPLYHDLIDFSEDRDRPILNALFDAMTQCMEEHGFTGQRRVALAAFKGQQSSRGDEEIVRDFFIERGIETNLMDPREVEWRSGGLYSNGVRIQGVIRAMTSRHFLRYPREMKDFLDAVVQRGICLVNSFRAILGSEKSILSFLTDPLNHHYLTPEEVKVIQDHVPWTRTFDQAVTLSNLGEEVSLKAYMIKHREELVIKPSSGAGGQGVLVGKDTEPSKWGETIDDNIGSPDWVVQEYVPLPTFKLPVIKKNKVVLEQKYLNLSPYVFGGRYAGILGRVSDQSVINVSAGGGMIPVFQVKESVENARATDDRTDAPLSPPGGG